MKLEPIISISGFSEPFSSMSHLLAAGIMLVLGIWLIIRGRGKFCRVLSYSVFTFSSVFLLSMSGVFHLLEPGTTGREVLQRLDHAGIFLLIAGTITPVHGIMFHGWWRWGMLIPVWVVAITGITLKSIFFHEMAEWLGLILYLGMGWLGAISAILLKHRYGFALTKPLIYGAIAYTAGAMMEFLRLPELIPGVIGPHELFHIAVLFGLGFHYVFIARFAKINMQTS